MSEDNKTLSVDDSQELEELSIGQLRQYASLLGVGLSRTDNMTTIRQKILDAKASKRTATIVDAKASCPPGWAKIVVNKDPMPGAANLPVYVYHNGYAVTIPRGVPVLVPLKIIGTLNDAAVDKQVQHDSAGQGLQTVPTRVLNFPFQVLDMTPGPDPKPGLEALKAKTHMPRVRFRDKFGYWPKRDQLMKAIENGLIQLGDDETLSRYETKRTSA